MIRYIYFCLLYLSFFPLWLSIIVRYMVVFLEQNNVPDLIFSILILIIVILFVFSCFIVYDSLKNKKNKRSMDCEIIDITEEKVITLEYILSYVLPLIAFDFQKSDDVILFLIYFLSISFLSVKHHVFSLNFFLELFGYSFYQCTLKENKTGIILKKWLFLKKIC